MKSTKNSTHKSNSTTPNISYQDFLKGNRDSSDDDKVEELLFDMDTWSNKRRNTRRSNFESDEEEYNEKVEDNHRHNYPSDDDYDDGDYQGNSTSSYEYSRKRGRSDYDNNPYSYCGCYDSDQTSLITPLGTEDAV